MKIEFVGKNVSITEGMKEYATKKLEMLNKYSVIKEDTLARVLARVYFETQKVEINIQSRYGLIRCEVVAKDYYSAIDLAINKLKDQIRRIKTGLEQRKKRRSFIENAALENFANEKLADDKKEVVKTKTINADEMCLDEAIGKMELLGHTFFIYEDEESEKMSVVYKRYDGNYGLIEVD